MADVKSVETKSVVKDTGMENVKLKLGSVVRLKSGSPTMTVEGITENGNAQCCWLHSDGHSIVTRVFSPQSLVFVE